jgi:hypothetical protein
MISPLISFTPPGIIIIVVEVSHPTRNAAAAII